MKINVSSVLKKRVMPYAPYAFVFWLANKIGMAYRLADGDGIIDKIAGSADSLSAAMQNAAPSFHPFDLLIGICGAALIYAVVYFKGKNAKKYRKDTEYGSACWGTEKISSHM